MQCAVGNRSDIRRSHVVVLDLAENFGIDAHLLVCARLLVAGMHSNPPELAQNEAQAKSYEDYD